LGPPPELAALPPDRFGFQQSREAVGRESGKWSLVAWVAVFTLISLGAGWVAGHGEWRTVVQRIGGKLSSASTTTQQQAQLAPPPDLSEIEVVDRSNRRWMIPMEPRGPDTAASSNRTDSPAPSRRNASTIPNSNLPSPVPPRPSVDEIKPPPPILPVAPTGSENVLPLGDSADAQRAVPAPTPRTPSGINSSDLQPGELTHKVDPEYPPAALTQRVEGTVKILVVIGLDGNVKTVQPLSGPPMLIPAALNAVRQWRYSPTLLHGRRIETQREISVAFRIAGSR
jgi:periplasmic protein TonB